MESWLCFVTECFEHFGHVFTNRHLLTILSTTMLGRWLYHRHGSCSQEGLSQIKGERADLKSCHLALQQIGEEPTIQRNLPV